MNFFIEPGLLNTQILKEALEPYPNRLAVISDEKVAALYGRDLVATLKSWGKQAELFSFPCGEKYKTRETKQHLEDLMMQQGYGRDSAILALGGGIVCDLAGFIAATYCRGLPLFLLPTTLLAMVDASIGGKTGVNTPFGKNLVGAFYQPEAVLMDTAVLQTLPYSEFCQGFVEMIKHALIADNTYFDFLEKEMDLLLAFNEINLKKAIQRSVEIKQAVVQADCREQDMRRLLNFGHTVGHALEFVSNYTLPHGSAVACGLLAESHLSFRLGTFSENSLKRAYALTRKCLNLDSPQEFCPQSVWKAMQMDKKALQSKPKCVFLDEIGSISPANFCRPLEETDLLNSLEWMRYAVHSDQWPHT